MEIVRAGSSGFSPASVAAMLPTTRILNEGVNGSGISIYLLGDSTGNETDEWFYRMVQAVAPQYPGITFDHILFDDPSQTYAFLNNIQVGTNGRRNLRFAGVANQGVQMALADVTTPTGDQDIACWASLDNWKPAARNHLVSHFTASTTYGIHMFIEATTGTIGLGWSPDGTTLVGTTSSVAPTVTNGSKLWVRATLDVDNGSGGWSVTFYTGSDGVSWTQLGTVQTGTPTTSVNNPAAANWTLGARSDGTTEPLTGNIYGVKIRNGINGPLIAPANIDQWQQLLSASPTPTGSPTCTFVNGSIPGKGLTYLSDSTRLPKLLPDYGARLVFLSTSHNESTTRGPAYVSSYRSWISAIKSRFPNAAIVPIMQNPELAPPSTTAFFHSYRRRELMGMCSQDGLGFIDVYKAFEDDPRGLSALIQNDGTGFHPTNSGGNDGEQLWLNTVLRPWNMAAALPA